MSEKPSDQKGVEYKAEVDSSGIQFTSLNGRTSGTGVWKRDSAKVEFEQESGALNGFIFTFKGNPHHGQDARGTFRYRGSQDEAEAALEAAGLTAQVGGFSRWGDDFRSDPTLDINIDNATHFNFDRVRAGARGNFHTGEWNLGAPHHMHGKQATINFMESLLGLHLGGDE
jgi:hypothetical protein